MLLYDKLIRDYSDVTNAEAIVAGILHASDDERYSLATSEGPELASAFESKQASDIKTMSSGRAQAIVKSWRSESDSVGDRFIDEFKRAYRPGESKSGLIYDRRALSDEEAENFTQCFDRSYRPEGKWPTGKKVSAARWVLTKRYGFLWR